MAKSIAEILDSLRDLLEIRRRRSLPQRKMRKVREKGGLPAIKLFRRRRNDKRNQRRKHRKRLGRPRDKDDKKYVPGRDDSSESHHTDKDRKKKKKKKKKKNESRRSW